MFKKFIIYFNSSQYKQNNPELVVLHHVVSIVDFLKIYQ